MLGVLGVLSDFQECWAPKNQNTKRSSLIFCGRCPGNSWWEERQKKPILNSHMRNQQIMSLVGVHDFMKNISRFRMNLQDLSKGNLKNKCSFGQVDGFIWSMDRSEPFERDQKDTYAKTHTHTHPDPKPRVTSPVFSARRPTLAFSSRMASAVTSSEVFVLRMAARRTKKGSLWQTSFRAEMGAWSLLLTL